jgi:hypothetical protein
LDDFLSADLRRGDELTRTEQESLRKDAMSCRRLDTVNLRGALMS